MRVAASIFRSQEVRNLSLSPPRVLKRDEPKGCFLGEEIQTKTQDGKVPGGLGTSDPEG